MDYQSRQLAEDCFLREPVDARIRKVKEEPKEDPHPNLKVTMQTVRLNPDSQKLILDTLRYIHGPDFKLGSASLYKDKGTNLSNRYWMERGNLVVQGGCDYSLTNKPDIETSEARLRAFALAKLEKYHFHKAHCAEALELAAESVDKALETLFHKYFKTEAHEKPEDVPSQEELLEMRNDEKAVLESIYESSFRLKENNVWNLKLNLDYLTKMYETKEVEAPKTKKNINYNSNFKTKKKEVCKLFLKGPCRFGAKCKFSHEVNVEPVKTEPDHLESSKVNYELEVRFPDDTVYPYEPPLLFFKTEGKTSVIPDLTCLRITARLIEESKILAQDGIPSIYSLVELLNNEEDILNFIQFDTRSFPEPSDALFPQLIENSGDIEKKPSHYKKGDVKDKRAAVDFEDVLKENADIAKRWLEKRDNNRYNKMMSGRRKLPAWQKKNEILNAMKKSQVIVISGETGCGKSTQVPQYILDDWLDNFNKGGRDHVEVVCTQPRRISAIGVAERVAEERVEKAGQVVGYQIRLESKVSSKTRLTFCTTGILLRRLEYDPQLRSVTHILVDEVHERSEESDFLLLILRDLVKVRKDLTVILMSATLNAELFSDYFEKVPVLEIPGRTFPVEQVFLEEIMEVSNYVLEENGPYGRKVKKGDKDKKIDLETELEACDVRASMEPPKTSIRDENLTVAQVVARYPKCSKATCKNMYLMDTEKINLELVEHTLNYIVDGNHKWPREGAILIFLPGIAEIMSLHDQLAESHTFSPKKVKEEPKEDPHPNLKVTMQTVRLNPDSQKLILDTLRYIHGPDFKLGSASLYKDKGTNLSNRYWMERGNLVVQGGCDYSLTNKPDIETSEARLRAFALAKLEKYHFHKAHCAEALELAAESVDKALETLFHKYFKTEAHEKPEDVPSQEELLEMRNDEKAVLESIYESSFRLKENNVWNLKLNLDYLTKMYETKEVEAPKTKKNINYNSNFKTKKKEVCKLFLKGPCRFGAKCKFSHEVNVEPVKTEPDHLESSKVNYELEVRFPDDTVYPYEPPLLFFKTEGKTSVIPDLTCLRITARLIEESKILAQDGIPSIYSLVELLNNEEDILNFIQFDTRSFPEPSDALFPQLIENSGDIEKKPSHYKKGDVKDKRAAVDFEDVLKENADIAKRWLEKRDNNRYNKMMSGRRKLPAWQKKNEILNAMKKSQVIVISGETGCGKSTQVPQYILDDWLDNFNKGGRDHVEVVCTQPRRISAIGVAERVAEERVEKAGQVVGYQIRLESKVSSKTRLTFCTTGILLRRLEYDPQLRSVTHILVDEVHERSEESDFLLLILRDLVKVRKDLTVILMSATLNAELFSDYFEKVPVLEIPGRTFPVEQVFLEEIMEVSNYVLEENGPYGRKVKKGDKDKKIDLETELEACDVRASMEPPKTSIRDENLTVAQVVARYPKCSKATCKNMYLMDTEKINLELVEHTLNYIVDGNHKWPREGAILIFLPGIAEIMSLHDQLAESHTFSPKTGKYILIPLHSTLSSEEQSLVFSKTREGVRKIVLSTNIAETSVTIDDCVFVIDCGRMKEKRFDSNRNMESLELVWVSRANAKQRKGRAGRVMPGVCVHLYTSHRYNYHILEQPVPEIHRVPLEQLLLKIKILPLFQNMSVHEVLGKTIEPPAKPSIDSALCRLQDVGALDKAYALTALGAHLAALPVDVRIGKLMLFGAIFCCVDSALTMAACLSHKSPFVAPFGKKSEADAKRKEFACANSDQLTTLRAYRKWQLAMQRSTHAALVFASENFLSHKTLLMLGDIKHQLLGLLAAIGFVPDMPDLRKKMRKDSVASLTGQQLNSNGDNDKLLAAILCAALYPNVVKVLTPEKSFHMQAGGAIPRQPNADELKFKTKTDGYVALHPSSINSNVGYFNSPYLVYQEKVKTSRVFIRECSMVPQLPLVLFSGCNLSVELHNGTFIVSLEDGWIMFQVEKHEVAEMLKTIRVELINLLEEKINDPCLNLLNYEKGNKIIQTIVQVVTKD